MRQKGRFRGSREARSTMKVTFEFHGGFKDGEVVTGDTDALDGPAKGYLYLTDQGRVGARFSEKRPLDQEVRKMIEERLAKGPGAAGPKPKRGRPVSPADIFFGRRVPNETLHAAENLLTYVYEVTRREETEDGLVVHVDCAPDPEIGHQETA
jgi:hypothetical protein